MHKREKLAAQVALATGAFQTSRGVMHGALEQRAAQDCDGRGELGGQLLAFVHGLFSCHQ